MKMLLCLAMLMTAVAMEVAAAAPPGAPAPAAPGTGAGPAGALSGAALPGAAGAKDGKDAAAKDGAGKEGAGGAPRTMLEELTSGGALHVGALVVLLVFSIFEFAVIFERLFNLRRGKVLPPGFRAELEELTRRNETDPEAWRSLCRRFPDVPSAEIVAAGLSRVGHPLPEIEKAMEDAAVRESGALRAWIRPLAVMGNLGPLVGLLGTVFGMIMAFRTAAQGGLGKAELMAHGISIALVTTVAGLVIAIPGYAAASWFNAKIDKMLRELDRVLVPATAVIARIRVGAASPTPAPVAAVVPAIPAAPATPAAGAATVTPPPGGAWALLGTTPAPATSSASA